MIIAFYALYRVRLSIVGSNLSRRTISAVHSRKIHGSTNIKQKSYAEYKMVNRPVGIHLSDHFNILSCVFVCYICFLCVSVAYSGLVLAFWYN